MTKRTKNKWGETRSMITLPSQRLQAARAGLTAPADFVWPPVCLFLSETLWLPNHTHSLPVRVCVSASSSSKKNVVIWIEKHTKHKTRLGVKRTRWKKSKGSFTWTDFLVLSTKSFLSFSSVSPSRNFPGFDSTISEPVKETTGRHIINMCRTLLLRLILKMATSRKEQRSNCDVTALAFLSI